MLDPSASCAREPVDELASERDPEAAATVGLGGPSACAFGQRLLDDGVCLCRD